MVRSYRLRETVEALNWTGKNKEELEEFVGSENVVWKLFTNKPPVPTINFAIGPEVELGSYIVKQKDNLFKIYNKDEFEELFEAL